MSITPKTYSRKAFVVQGIQVTAENMNEVAAWCLGEVREKVDVEGWSRKNNGRHIYVDKTEPGGRRMSMAFVGDWILCNENRFRIYSDKSFRGVFEPSTVDPAQRYADVYTLVVSAMRRQAAATYNGDTDGMDLVADEIVKKILKKV